MTEEKSEAPSVEAVNPQVQMIKMIKIMLIVFVLTLFAFGGMSFYFLKSMQSRTETPALSHKEKPAKKVASEKEESKKDEAHNDEGNKEEGNKEEGHKEEADKTDDKSAATDDTKPLYYKFSPSIITSIPAKDQMRYLRVDVELVSKDKAMIDNISTYAPIIRNELTNLFSSQSFEDLMLPQTKETLRKKVTDSVKKIMKDNTGQDNIDQVLFTTFIIQ